jgi:hypothetical protein
MCDFISWKSVRLPNGKEKLYYLTDKEVFSEKGNRLFTLNSHIDVLGHGAIHVYFGLDDVPTTEDHECNCFWKTENLPAEISAKIADFDTHWGRMFTRGCFQNDDLSFIIDEGPGVWKAKARQQLKRQNQVVYVDEFPLTVPDTYRHINFASAWKLGFESVDEDALPDDSYRRVTHRLQPGRTYSVKILRLTDEATIHTCLGIYRRNKALFVGAQGLLLAWQLRRDAFRAMYRNYYSLDVQSALPHVGFRALYPIIHRAEGRQSSFEALEVTGTGGVLHKYNHLVLFCR